MVARREEAADESRDETAADKEGNRACTVARDEEAVDMVAQSNINHAMGGGEKRKKSKSEEFRDSNLRSTQLARQKMEGRGRSEEGKQTIRRGKGHTSHTQHTSPSRDQRR